MLFLGIFAITMKAPTDKDTCAKMFIETLFIPTTERWEEKKGVIE